MRTASQSARGMPPFCGRRSDPQPRAAGAKGVGMTRALCVGREPILCGNWLRVRRYTQRDISYLRKRNS